jgi:hypothetical protein
MSLALPTIGPRLPTASTPTPPIARLTPAEAANFFVRWACTHGLAAREWTVDDVWFLASEDFAPALGLGLPPRRVFLGALQKVAGVSVAYDRRRYARNGRLIGKTTFYRLASPAAHRATEIERLAA